MLEIAGGILLALFALVALAYFLVFWQPILMSAMIAAGSFAVYFFVMEKIGFEQWQILGPWAIVALFVCVPFGIYSGFKLWEMDNYGYR